jgi:hypothetical protein
MRLYRNHLGALVLSVTLFGVTRHWAVTRCGLERI